MIRLPGPTWAWVLVPGLLLAALVAIVVLGAARVT